LTYKPISCPSSASVWLNNDGEGSGCSGDEISYPTIKIDMISKAWKKKNWKRRSEKSSYLYIYEVVIWVIVYNYIKNIIYYPVT